jgi:glycosyltransferase involved in cell wall biosynthesis
VLIAEVAPPWFPVPPTGYGGIEALVHTLVEGLVARGHDVTLFASPESRTSARLVSPLGRTVSLTDPFASDLEMAHVLSSFRQARDFDVIHDHTWSGMMLGAALDGPPVVHTIHGPWDDRARIRYQGVDDTVRLVAISDAQMASNPTVQYAGRVHNGVDVGSFPFRERKEDFLLFLGRSTPDKGPDLAIKAARLAGLPLVMVVKRHEDREIEYWEAVVEPLLGDDVEVMADDSEKLDLLSRAKATLFPITWPEPFGLVMIESMACGTPVIALPRGAAREVIDDGRTGFLCRSVEEMAEAVDRMGTISPEACRERVAALFSKQVVVDGYERILRAAVEEVGTMLSEGARELLPVALPTPA